MQLDGWNPLTRFVLPMVIALLVLAALVWFLQRRLVYLPAGPPSPAEDALAGAEDVTLVTEDGLQLAAWWVPGGPTAVIVLPGNAGNRAARAPLAEALAGRGLAVLLVDYRGYGGNPGTPSEAGLRADARAASAWVAGREDVEDVVVLGESLGAAVAVGLATDHRIAALVLRSPFPSLHAVAREHYGPVPAAALRDEYPVLAQIRELAVPVLVVAGEADTIVPAELSREVHAAAPEPKRYVSVPGAGHNDRTLLDGDVLIDAVVDFLADHGLVGR